MLYTVRKAIMNILKQLRLFKKFYLRPHTAGGPRQQQDFTMHLENIDMDDYNRRVRQSIFDHTVIETVRHENKEYPIFQLDWGAASNKRLLVLGGVHGNEIAGSLAVLDILDDIKHHGHRYKDWQVRIITPVNPVGLARLSRYDQDGYDLNRDFKTFDSIGAKLQRSCIEQFKPTIIVTMHESPDEGFYMFSEGKLPRRFKEPISNKLKNEKIPLAQTNFLHMKLQNGIWEKPRIIFAIQRVLGIYTLGRYTHEHQIPTITTESTWSDSDLAARRRPHMLVVQALLET